MSSLHFTNKILKSVPVEEDVIVIDPNAQWQWYSDKGWINYEDKQNKLIEESYAKHLKVIEIDEERFVDFATMKQRRIDNPSKCRRIQRISTNTKPKSSSIIPFNKKTPSVPSPKPTSLPNIVTQKKYTTVRNTNLQQHSHNIITKQNFLHCVNIPKASIPVTLVVDKPSFITKTNTSSPSLFKTQFTQMNSVNSDTQLIDIDKSPVNNRSDDEDIEIDKVLELFEEEQQQKKEPEQKQEKKKINFQYDNKLIQQFHSIQKLSKFVVGNPFQSSRNQCTTQKIFSGDCIYCDGEVDFNLKNECIVNGATFKIQLTPLINTIVHIKGSIPKELILWASTKNVPIINKDWLIECLKQKKRVDFKQYLVSENKINETRKHSIDLSSDDVLRLFNII
ncbi:WWE domain containing protein [Entamoeba nuttalli P19]|uniref:WWE domain containing protein n=1 Tax=Entamoeba nuttalli (strain P19) TaxID=1076696 RepID=K2GDZ8_ENTNP|nr:WWE domain containing protein [Entamoeba nuttalli P19]EKE40801.1 WWE domain containing protein [Entamoeba nuttalli P19]|eukprot:XP_008856870.1 WWE domain containing protein [Entamoeba nuttalli P19]